MTQETPEKKDSIVLAKAFNELIPRPDHSLKNAQITHYGRVQTAALSEAAGIASRCGEKVARCSVDPGYRNDARRVGFCSKLSRPIYRRT